jgi:SAM-dependent methyltransferase
MPRPLAFAEYFSSMTKGSFLDEFDKTYAPLLQKRAVSFRKVFEELESQGKTNAYIVETGTSRFKDNWEGDGQSTRLWDAYVNHHDGKVVSIDISKQACDTAKSMVSDKVKFYAQDSVKTLDTLPNMDKCDVLYLDSYDVDDINNTHLPSLHHIKELCAVYAKLPSGCIIIVDDNVNGKGKGPYVHDFLVNVGSAVLIDDYQIVIKKH